MNVPTSTPSAQGVDPVALSAFLDALEEDPRIEPHALIIQRHGHRILEGYWAPHRPGQLRLVYSLSKTFTGTALGLQIGEGRLTLDDLAADHFPDLLAGAEERTRRMRVRHLASMATGHDREMLLDALAADPVDAVRGFFALPPPHEPGTIFAYNQPPVLALATALQRLAGERLVDYLRPRLLNPLGVGDFRWYQYQPGIDLGFSGVYTNLDTVARLGQLYLDDGVSNGQRILPKGWVADASRPQIANPNEPQPDWRLGYGFQLWMCQHGYRGDGAFGQYMVVVPEHDVVVAFFSATEPMQAMLDHLWQILLPALRQGAGGASHADAGLAARVNALALPTASQRTGGSPPQTARGHFTPGPPPTHSTITAIDITDDRLTLREDDASLTVKLTDEWTRAIDAPAAASAAVDGDGGLLVDIVLLATPHRITLTIDRATATFSAMWPMVPLFGLGLEQRLTAIRPPD